MRNTSQITGYWRHLEKGRDIITGDSLAFHDLDAALVLLELQLQLRFLPGLQLGKRLTLNPVRLFTPTGFILFIGKVTRMWYGIVYRYKCMCRYARARMCVCVRVYVCVCVCVCRCVLEVKEGHPLYRRFCRQFHRTTASVHGLTFLLPIDRVIRAWR